MSDPHIRHDDPDQYRKLCDIENAIRECCRHSHSQNHRTNELLQEILNVLYLIEARLEPKFTLQISQVRYYEAFGTKFPYRGKAMAAITAGQSNSFFLSATASDNSTPVLANQSMTADDPNVSVVKDTTDASGNTFTVSVPATDTQTTFNLSATADATSNTSATPQSVSATLPVTITPGTTPVTFTLAINEK